MAKVLCQFDTDESGTENYSALVVRGFNSGFDVVGVGHIAQPMRAFDAGHIQSSRFCASCDNQLVVVVGSRFARGQIQHGYSLGAAVNLGDFRLHIYLDAKARPE